ncbi:hypothetical protein C9374_014151 [Naegleria lovaniensis]|uniref:AB hydrolase-1 domain-containing protein n=1 Tax=Naegleria lovaniensis TaxID=51637 RepID=A0AA88KQE0_NAELO|nr:uncharacterized protein C9374_014151 [Naegleria lovaniensis]KAG2389591.1 hypothetical protein C9374_014151 [Naegleria lovaniensis]
MLKSGLLRSSSPKTLLSSSSSTTKIISCCINKSNSYHTSKHTQALTPTGYEDLKRVDENVAFPWLEHVVPKRHQDHPYAIASLSFNGLGTGKKPPNPIVFIHDYTTNSKAFSTIARKLNYPYGIVTMDLRARGKTQVNGLDQLFTTQDQKEKAFLQNNTSKTGPLNLITHALDFVRLLTYYGLPRAFVVGHGFGANIAYMLMKKCPERISGAVLINGGYPVNKASMGEVTQLHERISGTFGTSLETLLTQDAAVKSDSIDFNSFVEYSKHQKNDEARLAALRDLRSIEDFGLSLDDLIRLRHPVALIRSEHGLKDGDKKPIIDAKVFKSMENVLNTKTAVTINGANHYNMLFDEKYAEQIANTIDRLVVAYDIHRVIEHRFNEVRGTESVKGEESK